MNFIDVLTKADVENLKRAAEDLAVEFELTHEVNLRQILHGKVYVREVLRVRNPAEQLEMRTALELARPSP